MISLQFENLNDLFLELEDKIDGIEQLVSRETKSQIAKAVFTITTKKFIKDMNMQAVLNPAKYFHMYEWNAVGNTNKKLFEVKRQSISDGNLKINISYKPSKTAVPIPPELKIPGKKGKSAKKRSVFVNKAEVMESGRPVSFTTKQFIVFLSQRDNKMRFIRPNKTVRIQQPGGKLTTRAFDKFLTRYLLF
jgi:phage antirepressor YoqD-like protein